MKGTDHFRETIKAYLTKRATTDPTFSASFINPKKSIDECVTYILNQVKQSGCNGFTDEEIFSMAMHYYDEANITVDKLDKSCTVIVNHTIELTEDEKVKAKEKAITDLTNEIKAKERAKTAKKEKAPEKQKKQAKPAKKEPAPVATEEKKPTITELTLF